jgi:hypothetical protein
LGVTVEGDATTGEGVYGDIAKGGDTEMAVVRDMTAGDVEGSTVMTGDSAFAYYAGTVKALYIAGLYDGAGGVIEGDIGIVRIDDDREAA